MKAVVAAVLCISMSGAWAALGGAPANFGPRVLAAKSQTESTGGAAYSDLERKLDSGTVVHEYVDASGVVFAVSWSGPIMPDLKEILGTHFDTMVAHAGRGARGGRSQIAVAQPDVVIVSAGHMGAFEGRAWLPAKLPAGFNPSDIK